MLLNYTLKMENFMFHVFYCKKRMGGIKKKKEYGTFEGSQLSEVSGGRFVD